MADLSGSVFGGTIGGFSSADRHVPNLTGSVFTLSPEVTPANAVAPVVGNFDPPQSTTINTNTPVNFDVTDDEGLFRRVIIHASFPDGTEEVVHDGGSFRGHYQAGNSSRVIISGGYRYTLLRAGGWPGNPTIRAFAIDQAGNEETA